MTKQFWAAFLSCFLPTLALAQVIPPSVDAGRVEQNLKPLQEPVEPIMAPKGYTRLAIPKGTEDIHFTLANVIIDGVTAYPPEHFKPLYADMVGKDVTLADMYVIADKVRRAYHEDSYILTQALIPEQRIHDGIIHIHVTEGYISRLRWNGEMADNQLMQDMAKQITDARPFNSKILENVMLRLNELPGISAQASLEPLPEKDAPEGALGLLVNIQRKRFSGFIGGDNYASRYLGVWETIDKVEGYGLFSSLDRLSFTGSSASSFSKLRYGALQYSLPINEWGTVLNIGGNTSKTHPGYRLSNLEIFSYANSVTAGISQPLLRSREETLDVSSQFNLFKQVTDVLDQHFTEDRLRIVTATANYTRLDSWSGVNLVEATLAHGLNMLGASESGSRGLSRPTGQSDFTKLNVTATRLQALPQDFSVLLTATGQKANASLLSSQQFGFGGSSFGRAYDSSEITGDEGVAGSIELRYQTMIDTLNLQPFVFYDIGMVENKEAFEQSVSGASAGFGFRAGLENFHLDTNMAWPLTYTPATPKLGAEGKQPRLNVSLNMTF